MKRWIIRGVWAGLVVTGLAAGAHVAFVPVHGTKVAAQTAGGGCPFAGGQNPHNAQELQRQRVAALAGEGRAQHKRVLGVTLGKSNRGALDVWAAARGMTCLARRDSHDIECKADTPGAVAAQYASAEELTVFAGFNEAKVLTQLRLIASFSDPVRAAEALRHTLRESEAHAGQPTHISGEPEAHYLSSALWQQARVEYRRSDLYTSVSATNLGNYVSLSHHVESLGADETDI